MNLTIDQAAARLGVSRQRVQQFIAEGRLKALKFGKAWVIAERDANRLATVERPNGRPARR